jgi:phosphoglycolate phosphatase-like HAD superfamily hydrolase
LFIGDSRYDYQASKNAGLDFVFLSDWTDLEDWRDFCDAHQIKILPNLGALITH